MTCKISASHEILSLPIKSKSHCVNSLYLPLCARSPRNTFPIAYRLKGNPTSFLYCDTKRAKGTVKSNLNATSRPP